MKNSILIILSLCTQFSLHAQTILTVSDENVSKSEYVRVYEKNLLDKNKANYSKEKLDQFTDLYTLFLMKLKEARAQKLDTSSSFKYELKSYKNQLATKFAQENDYILKLTKEEYNRLQNEWNISHILLKNNSSGMLDTAAALAKMNSIKQEISSGALTFAEAANKYSEDTYSNSKGGEMGWLTAMQAPYDFETAIVETAKGQISTPCYTKYGMHIIRVNDKRPNFGQIKVAQILINAYNASPEKVTAAKTKADMVYNEIKAGKISFEDAVEKYSEDQFSNKNNGEMEWFGPGENVAIFEDACVAMKIGDMTQPIHTDFGYHIIKKIDEKPLPSFDEIGATLKQTIQRSDRGAIAREQENEDMFNLLDVKQHPETLNQMIENLDSARLASDKISREERMNTLFSISGQNYTEADFIEKYRKEGLNANKQPKVDMIKFYSSYLKSEVQSKYLDYLSTKNPEFNNLLKDYEDGLLIFALMEKNVWQKAATDTLGLAQYYEKHSDKYQWNNAIEYDLYQSDDKSSLEKLIMTLGKINSVPEEAIAIVQESLPEARLTLQHKTQEIDQLPEEVQEALKSGQNSQIIELRGQYQMYAPILYTPGTSSKTFSQAKSYVISDYQNQLDQEWTEYLKSKYPVKINTSVYNTLIQ